MIWEIKKKAWRCARDEGESAGWKEKGERGPRIRQLPHFMPCPIHIF